MQIQSPSPSARFCAVIPAYNVAHTMAECVQRTLRHLSRVLVVDDGSGDDTARLAEEHGASVIRIAVNRGKGWALRCGFQRLLEQPWEGVITLDGDLQHDPDDIPGIIAAFDRTGADLVAGSRMARTEDMPRVRYYTNRVGVFCISWAAGQPIEDSQSGFRLYSRKLIEAIPLRTTHYDTETELTVKAGLKGMRIVSTPIKTIYHGGTANASHYRPFTDTFLISMVFLKSLFWRRGIRL
ncbi:MAG TPA: glycosyltransferase family 2 protein [Syntrophobacteraceae bacterium]|nr:glycosyltransferase family 2 protein [Syntrophobacteraceae bacterium]